MKFMKIDVSDMIVPGAIAMLVIGAIVGAINDQTDEERQRLAAALESGIATDRASAIAEENWDKCNFVLRDERGPDGVMYYARLEEGQVVTDSVDEDRALPNGMVVCSVYGDLGFMKDGVATNVVINQKVARMNVEAAKSVQNAGVTNE